MRTRFVILDLYRYLAAVGIIVFHADAIDPTARGYLRVDGLNLFVDFFFILSGFVLFHTYSNMKISGENYYRFIAKRLARIYPLHILTMFAVIVTYFTFPQLTRPFSIQDIIANVFLVQAWGVLDHASLNVPSWSISAEFFCYLLFPLMLPLILRVPAAITIAFSFALYFALSRFWPFWESGIFGATYDFGMLRALPTFILGCGMYRIYQQIPSVRNNVCIWGGAALFCGGVLLMILYSKPVVILAVFAITVVVTAIGERAGTMNAALSRTSEWFGECSYAIYLIHGRMLALIAAPLWASSGLPISYLPIALMGFIAFATIVARIIYVYYELPAKKWMTAALLRRLPQSPPVTQP